MTDIPQVARVALGTARLVEPACIAPYEPSVRTLQSLMPLFPTLHPFSCAETMETGRAAFRPDQKATAHNLAGSCLAPAWGMAPSDVSPLFRMGNG